jgi:hypothetical protein
VLGYGLVKVFQFLQGLNGQDLIKKVRLSVVRVENKANMVLLGMEKE